MRKQPHGTWLVVLAGCCLLTASTRGQQVSSLASELDPSQVASMQVPPPAPVSQSQVEREEPAPTREGITNNREIRPRDESRVTSPTVFAITGGDCTLIDFEGLGDQEPIGEIAGAITVTFSEEWLSIIDSDEGGTGNFANEPSPDTISFFVEEAGPINFSEGVQYVEIYYVGAEVSIPVTLNAWSGLNGGGDLLDSQQGHTIGRNIDGADCEGDPNGAFCLFDRIVLTSGGNDIRSISLSGAVPNFIGFDNMTFCTANPVVGACCLPDGRCAETTRENCNNQSGEYHGDNTRCRDFNCRLGACCNGKECSLVEPQDCDGTFNGFGSDCDPNPCVGACCLPGEDTGCGFRPGDCVLTRGPGCDDQSGNFLGLGTECEQDLLIINHNGPREQWSHEIVTVSACEENPGPGGGCVDCANNYYDPWTTAEPVGGGNCEDFSHEDSCPLPADFFGPGSDPFDGEICFKGQALGVQQVPGCGGPLDFGAADTIVRRFEEPFAPCDAPLNVPVEVEIVMERLNLVSCDPVSIHFAGGGKCTRDPEWVCDGDTDGDGQVNPVDSGLVQANFGSTNEADLCQYDVDCDGQINPVDSGIVQSLFGTCNDPRPSCEGGGGGRDELWDVRVEVLSSTGQPRGGTLTARKQHCNGGIFNSTLPVCPTFIFTQVDDPNNEVRLEFCDACDAGGIIMNATAVPWVTDAGDAQGLVSPVCSDFHPGLEEENPRSDCNCDRDDIHDDCEADRDGDEVIDDCDNCPDDDNPDQEDRDKDGIGDLCDECPDDPGDDCRGACCAPGSPCDWDNGITTNGQTGRALSPPNFPDIRVVDDFRFTKPCAIGAVHANVIEDAGWTDGGTVEVCVYQNARGGGPGPIVECESSSFTKMATGDSYFGRDDYDYWIGGLSISLTPGTYWMGIRNPGGGGSGTNYWMTSDGGTDGPGIGPSWFSLNAGGSWTEEAVDIERAFEIKADPIGGNCNWDNDTQPNGFSARAVSPPNFPDIRVADDFSLAAPCTLRQVHANFIEDEGWDDGGRISVLIYRDNAGEPGPVIAGANTTFTKMATGDAYFGRDDYDYWVEDLEIGLAAGNYWLGLRNPRGNGSGTNYWTTSDGGPDGAGTSTGFFSLDAGGTWSDEGAGWQHAFEFGIGSGGCVDVTESDCADIGGSFNRGATCEEGPCNGACCVPSQNVCDWDNGLRPDGFSARALSPPNFPDIRVADDFQFDADCTIFGMNANVIEDAGWTHGGSITVEVRANAGGSPGAIVDTHVGGFTRTATGDAYFGRDDFDYAISGMSIGLPTGTYWVGFRNPLGGGSGTNYWMTSTGGVDGAGTATGHFSLDAGGTWSDEGAGWQHAFELDTRGRECIQTTESDCINQRGRFAFGVDCGAGTCVNGACCLTEGVDCAWDNGLQTDGFSARAMSPPNFPDIRVADDFRLVDDCTVSMVHANVIEDAGWTHGGVITVEVRADSGGSPGAIAASRVSGFTRTATGDQYFGRDNFDYWIEPAPIPLAAGTYWLTLRNHLGGGSGSNYWMTSEGGADGAGSSTGYVSFNAGDTWSEEGAGWHHAFEIEAGIAAECDDLLGGECGLEGGTFRPGEACIDGPCG